MFTTEYKPGHFIHGYIDREECRVSAFSEWPGGSVKCVSLHAAKCWITRYING